MHDLRLLLLHSVLDDERYQQLVEQNKKLIEENVNQKLFIEELLVEIKDYEHHDLQ